MLICQRIRGEGVESSDFNKVYSSTGLHDYIGRESRRYSKRMELQEEYRQEAWLSISQAPVSLTTGEQNDVATLAMESAYWQNRKEVLAQKAIFLEPESQELKEGFDWVVEELEISTVYIDKGNYK